MGKQNLIRQGLAVAVILLFIGVALAPSINAEIESNESTCTNFLDDGTLSGYVYDNNMEPIKEALVRVYFHETYKEDYTDSFGYYHVTNIPICYCLKNATASKAGYTTEWVLLSIDENTTYDFVLTPLDGNTLYVGGDGPGNYTTIQEAIDNASNGDMVYVYDDSSPYYENVVVDKSINLIGENRETTIIDGDFMYDSVVWILSDWVNISGFTIQNSGRSNDNGISIDSNHCVISRNIIRNNDYCGICMVNSSYNIISENIIIDNGFDLGHGYGISLAWESNHNIICQNIIYDNDESGIRLFHSANNIMSGNTIENNHGHGGIALEYSNENNISENNIVDNSGSGVELRDFSNYNLVFRNNIENNGYGVDLDDSFFNSVIENNFMKNFINACFANSFATRWRENYWNRNRLAPKIIFGGIYSPGGRGIPFPWINIDWNPAQEPYDIG